MLPIVLSYGTPSQALALRIPPATLQLRLLDKVYHNEGEERTAAA